MCIRERESACMRESVYERKEKRTEGVREEIKRYNEWKTKKLRIGCGTMNTLRVESEDSY